MAGIGLYGVFYAKATIADGALTGYQGAKSMGKAISASFEPGSDGNDNHLWANNAIAESDAAAAAGGTLTVTLDRLTEEAHEDLFGLTKKEESVNVGDSPVTGTGYDYTGNEQSAAVGVAFIRWRQEDQSRAFHEAVIFSHCTFHEPDESFETYDADNGVEWQTPELEATVAGGTSTGTFPWRKKYTFPTQEAAVAFIKNYFAAKEE